MEKKKKVAAQHESIKKKYMIILNYLEKLINKKRVGQKLEK